MLSTHTRTLIVLTILAGALALGAYLYEKRGDANGGDTPAPPAEMPSDITSFQDCLEAGFPIMESYPRQCRTPEGEHFTEDIGNALEKQDLIRVDAPRPNARIESPLTIEGEARGYWFFEASFSARLLDADGNEIAVVPVEAQDDWMTEDFVPFEAELSFEAPETAAGVLRLERANPSGLPENDDALIVPVTFE